MSPPICGDLDPRRVVPLGGQADRPEIDVLDRPAFADDGGDRHLEGGRVAFPRDDNRRDVGLRAGEVLDGARDGARRAGGAELESLHEPREPENPEPENPEPRTRTLEPRTEHAERRTPNAVDAKLARWSDQ